MQVHRTASATPVQCGIIRLRFSNPPYRAAPSLSRSEPWHPGPSALAYYCIPVFLRNNMHRRCAIFPYGNDSPRPPGLSASARGTDTGIETSIPQRILPSYQYTWLMVSMCERDCGAQEWVQMAPGYDFYRQSVKGKSCLCQVRPDVAKTSCYPG